jgi:hypothetical protein
MINQYEEFCIYYIEILDTWAGYASEMAVYMDSGEQPPEFLAKEYNRHNFILAALRDAARQLYRKEPSQIMLDGERLIQERKRRKKK